MYNLVHHRTDFKIEASWTSSASGHGKGPCDGIGAVVKSMATQHLLKGGPTASFTSAEEFFRWCFQKNDRMVFARPCSTASSCSGRIQMPEPNRPIEIRWLPSTVINDVYDAKLQPRWNQLSSRGTNSQSYLLKATVTICRFDYWYT